MIDAALSGLVEAVSGLGTPILGLLATLFAFTVVWLISLPLRNAAIVDVFWGLGFVGLAWLYRGLGEAEGVRGRVVAVLVTIWGVRLATHILLRSLGRGEDFRYQAMRDRAPGFPIRSLYSVFWLQALILWVVGMPLYAVQRPGAPPIGWLDVAASLLFALGFLFEAVGDMQLQLFRSDPSNQGKVMDRGLWRYTRHPNYFGDATLWWGFGLFAVGAGEPWAVVGPIVITFLLLRVSGVSLLERSLEETKPRYRNYVRRTSSFFPLPPRTSQPE